MSSIKSGQRYDYSLGLEGRHFVVLKLNSGWYWMEDSKAPQLSGPFRLMRDAKAEALQRANRKPLRKLPRKKRGTPLRKKHLPTALAVVA
jgi:hypothetical protein